MSEQIEVQQLAEQLAAQGQEVLVGRLHDAYTDAVAAHADIISIDPSRIDALVQRAAERADGVLWRRALAEAAADRLGVSLQEALEHPAVARAQELAGAPSYEQSLSELMAKPARVPDTDDVPSGPSAPLPGQEELFPASSEASVSGEEGHANELQEVEADDGYVDLLPPVDPGEFAEPAPEPQSAQPESGSSPAEADAEPEPEPAGAGPQSESGQTEPEPTYVSAEDEAATLFSVQDVAQADAPTSTYAAQQISASDANDDAEPEDDADAAAEPDSEPPAASPLAGLAKAKVIDPHATQVHDMAAEFRSQDQDGGAAESVTAATQAARQPPPPKARPSIDQAQAAPMRSASDPDATALHQAPTPAPAPRPVGRPSAAGPRPVAPPPRRPGRPVQTPPVPYPDEPEPDGPDAELRVPAVHLGGVANLPTRGEPLDLRISEAGLDILQADEEILGRLQWSDIGQLEAANAKGRLLGKGKGDARLIVRTRHGDASFEVHDMSIEELRGRIAELSTRYGH